MKDGFGWQGGVKPKPPAEGFATGVSVSMGNHGVFDEAPEPLPADVEGEGLGLKLDRMIRKAGPERVRPSGRFKLP